MFIIYKKFDSLGGWQMIKATIVFVFGSNSSGKMFSISDGKKDLTS